MADFHGCNYQPLRNTRMTIRNLDDLFLHELQEAYAAEKLIVAAFSEMAMADSTAVGPLSGYATRARQRTKRLDQVFQLIGRQPDDTKRPAMAGMLAEIDELVGTDPETEAHAAAVLSVLQTVQHYLMARYVTLASWANQLGKPELERLLAATLEEERAALAQPAEPVPDRRDQDQLKGVSMGERLTALFDRKR
jgi:ferritin-like metal-binding protein YciE